MGRFRASRAYTGIGSRETPAAIMMRMITMARRLARNGFVLRTGSARGADWAFEKGCDKDGGAKEIYIPHEGFMSRSEAEPGCLVVGTCFAAEEIAAEIHPAWHNCTELARTLHMRSVYQVLGPHLNDPSRFLICWTPRGRVVGGSRTAIVLARRHGVPVFNLGAYGWTLGEIAKEVIERQTRIGLA